MAPFHATFAQIQRRKERLFPPRHHCFAVANNKTGGGGENTVVVMRCNRHVLWSPHISQQFLRSANNELSRLHARKRRELATLADCAECE